jgi:restriction system protein
MPTPSPVPISDNLSPIITALLPFIIIIGIIKILESFLKPHHRRKNYSNKRNKSSTDKDLAGLIIAAIFLAVFIPIYAPQLSGISFMVTLLLVGVIGTAVFFRLYHEYKLSKAGIQEIDNMSGTDFEKYLKILFEKLGYSVEHVGHSGGDYGVDLVLESDGIKTAVQAKRHSGSVGDDAIQAVVGGKNYYGCKETMVITNNYFTPMAEDLAKVDDVELWNRDKLVDIIIRSQSSANEQPQLSSDNDEIPLCPKCNLPMVKRLGKYGEFWGCIHFPGCDGTRNIGNLTT